METREALEGMLAIFPLLSRVILVIGEKLKYKDGNEELEAF